MRSQKGLDKFLFSQHQSMHVFFVNGRNHFLAKTNSFLRRTAKRLVPMAIMEAVGTYAEYSPQLQVYWEDGSVHWHLQLSDFDFGLMDSECLSQVPGKANWTRREGIWQIPYWSIVIPLSLLSAWLLLSKPRSTRLASRRPDSDCELNKRPWPVIFGGVPFGGHRQR